MKRTWNVLLIFIAISAIIIVLTQQSQLRLAPVKPADIQDKQKGTKMAIVPKRPDGYDMIDIGSSKGSTTGSINFLSNKLDLLGMTKKKIILDPRELGLDFDHEKVATCRKNQEKTNNECAQGDILNLTIDDLSKFSERTIQGNSFWHVLEHIPNCDMAEEMWVKAASLSKSFSSFHGPAYDREMSASGETPTGFHRYWENWHGHTCHFNSTMMERAIKATKKATAYVIVNIGKIESTDDPLILPAGSTIDSGKYNPKLHSPKKIKSLAEKELYNEMRACAIYRPKIFGPNLPLFSALCLWDVLNIPKKHKLSHEVVACRIGDKSDTSKEECIQFLNNKVIDALMNFYQTDTENILSVL